MLDYEKLQRALQAYPPKQREQVMELILSLQGRGTMNEVEVLDLVCSCVLLGSRAVGKRLSDRRTDKTRRTLVGARVPRELADNCKRAAEERGMSVYRWVVWALETALARPWWGRGRTNVLIRG